MADHNLPTLTSTYTSFVQQLDARLDDLAQGLDPAVTTVTNPAINSIRWSSQANTWQKWSGTSWGPLSALYAINISGNAASATTASLVTNGVYTAGNQTIGGAKTFSQDLDINGVSVGRGAGGVSSNTRLGSSTLAVNTTGISNTASGSSALASNTTGNYNTATGSNALFSNTIGTYNTANGLSALISNTTGYGNTASGESALNFNTTGFNNTAVGRNTGSGITTGSNNTILGANVTGLAADLTNNIILATGDGVQRARFNGSNWSFSGDVQVSSINGGSLAGMRNRIINPQGAIYQRAIAATADDVYFADRFYALTESSTVTPSVLADPEPGYPTGVRLTNNATQRFGFAQIIEGRNCKDLRGRTAICSPRIRVSGTQTIRYAILGWTGTEDVVTSDVVLNWASTSFTPGGFFISANLQVLALGSQSVTANTWTDLSGIVGAMGTTFNNLIIFVWTESQQASGFTLDFDNVDLEPGNIVTPPEFRDVGDELRRCQRYYTVFSSLRLSGHGIVGTEVSQSVYYSMRAIPVAVSEGFTLTNVQNGLQPIPTNMGPNGGSLRINCGGGGNFLATDGTLRLTAEL